MKEYGLDWLSRYKSIYIVRLNDKLRPTKWWYKDLVLEELGDGVYRVVKDDKNLKCFYPNEDKEDFTLTEEAEAKVCLLQ